MDLTRTWAIFRKEVTHIRRDPASLIQVVLLPVVMLLLNGYALNLDINRVPTAIYDMEGSQLSRDLLQGFRGSSYFQVDRYVSSYADINRLLDERAIWLALVVPHDFSRQVKEGKTAKIQALVDGTNANTANLILGYVEGVVSAYRQGLLVERLNLGGTVRPEAPVNADTRIWYNEDLESRNFIVPGLIAIIMTMVGALLTALCIIREKERGSMEGLMATPIKKSELILGKLGPYFIIGMFDAFLAMAMGQFLFAVPLRGNVFLFIGLTAIFMLVVLGQGLLISVTSHSQLEAYQKAMLTTFLPAFLLSGSIFAIAQMPLPLRLVSHLTPATYLVTISKGIYLKGIGLDILWPEGLALVAFAAFFLVMAGRKFVKKIQ